MRIWTHPLSVNLKDWCGCGRAPLSKRSSWIQKKIYLDDFCKSAIQGPGCPQLNPIILVILLKTPNMTYYNPDDAGPSTYHLNWTASSVNKQFGKVDVNGHVDLNTASS